MGHKSSIPWKLTSASIVLQENSRPHFFLPKGNEYREDFFFFLSIEAEVYELLQAAEENPPPPCVCVFLGPIPQ